MSAVLVLNADCGPLHRVSLRHAIRMLERLIAGYFRNMAFYGPS